MGGCECRKTSGTSSGLAWLVSFTRGPSRVSYEQTCVEREKQRHILSVLLERTCNYLMTMQNMAIAWARQLTLT